MRFLQQPWIRNDYDRENRAIDRETIARRSRDRFNNHLDDAGLGFLDIRLLLPCRQHFLDIRAENTLSPIFVVNVAKFADALVTAGQVHAGFTLFHVATVCTASALVHVDAKTEPGGPFVAGVAALAADVDLIRQQAQEILILLSFQRTFPVLCVKSGKKRSLDRWYFQAKIERRRVGKSMMGSEMDVESEKIRITSKKIPLRCWKCQKSCCKVSSYFGLIVIVDVKFISSSRVYIYI